MSYKLDLPRDHKKYLVKKRFKRLLPCFLLFILFVVILYIYGPVIVNTDVVAFRVSVYALILLLPFLITGVPFKMLDKTYCGRVEKVFVDSVMVKDPRNGKMTSANLLSLAVRSLDGKLKVHDIKYVANNRAPAYKEGDDVFHLAGTSIVMIIPDSVDATVQCAICGDSNDVGYSRCRGCGHTLIKQLPKYKKIY